MGKFEVFLLGVGVVALVIYGQMPAQDQQASAPVFQSSQGDGDIYGFPIVAQFWADVFDVVDGDSIRLTTANGRVDLRLASIDAPEWSQRSGQAAKRHLEQLTSGRRATFFQIDTDRYDRPVVFMVVSGNSASDRSAAPFGDHRQIDVNAQMVADGHAWHAIAYSSSERLAAFERQAMEKRLGLWADANPVPPWEFRARK